MTSLFRTSFIAFLSCSVTQAFALEVWNVKCFDAKGQTIPLEAISADGKAYDVKAIGTQDPDFFNIKALHPISGEQLPVKVVAPQDESHTFADVKAIISGNQLVGIKGTTGSGELLRVKGFLDDVTGLYDIKCLASEGEKLGLKAISPAGRVYDVKGIVALPDQKGFAVKVLAHIKAVPQKD